MDGKLLSKAAVVTLGDHRSQWPMKLTKKPELWITATDEDRVGVLITCNFVVQEIN